MSARTPLCCSPYWAPRRKPYRAAQAEQQTPHLPTEDVRLAGSSHSSDPDQDAGTDSQVSKKASKASVTSYGSMKRLTQPETFEETVTTFTSIASLLGCCIVLPYLIYGAVLAMLSESVPPECHSSLRSVFLGLGLSYIGVSCLFAMTLTCGARTVVGGFLHLVEETRYIKEDCDEEADIEGREAQRSFRYAYRLWPCLFLGIIGLVCIVVGWIWGIFEAVEATGGNKHCGRSSALFWVMMGFMLITKLGLLRLATYCNFSGFL
mmetsp:Transcript_869/g.1960  ORF Transcript_869/g.1960 Transcript_869/m.1960 type:complete len:264 (-) Transcript_869:30-821(-)